MVKRFIIHVKNLKISIKWIFHNYIKLKNHLESKGYYTLSIYKIWLWKKDARYFKVYNVKGECFFIKMKSKQSIISESRALSYLHKRNFNMVPFYPNLVNTNISEFNYNIYINIDGEKISVQSFATGLIDQIRMILDFLKENRTIHRDIGLIISFYRIITLFF